MNLQRLTKMPRIRTIAQALGWFSIGLGLMELALPRTVARASGMSGKESGLVRAYGARELATGWGLLKAMDPVPLLWGRVAGDALDLLTVGLKARGRGGNRTRATVALAALAGVAALDVMAARRARQQQTRFPVRDYSDRSGFPRPASQMRGAALQRGQPPQQAHATEAVAGRRAAELERGPMH